VYKLGLAFALAATVFASAAASAKEGAAQTLPVALSSLPAQAQETQRLVRSGGPFPYVKDGAVFGNRERLLPLQRRGHYREYTVKTPGARDRGARRVVCGGRQPTAPEACFYTDDHYTSFRRIVP
jgi:ribonuclease T1